MHGKFLTRRELAELLGCSIPAIAVWRRQGMPARHFGRLVRYELEPVLAWFDHRAQHGADQHAD